MMQTDVFSAAKHRARSAVKALGLVTLFGLAGCDGDDGDGGSERELATIVLLDEHNYTSTSRFAIPTVETAAGVDIEICWNEVTDDLQCHPVDPLTEIDNVSLLRFERSSHDEIATKLSTGPLATRDVGNYLDFHTDDASTCTLLSTFTQFGTPLALDRDYKESPEDSYMMVFTRGTTPGVGARTMLFVRPSADSITTRVDAPPGCGILEFEAHLADLSRLQVAADPPWRVSWSNVTRDGQGGPIDADSIDALLLGFYPGLTVAEVEARIFDLETLADPLWELELTGTETADLSQARARGSDEPFSGFDRPEDGVWMLALLCRTCQNPQPVVLSVLEP